MNADEDWRSDFEQAMGEEFGDAVCPPIPFRDASPHECCEVVWSVLGYQVTPTALGAMSPAQIAALAGKFGEYFGSEPPSETQVKEAVARTLARWPVGSFGEQK